MDPVELSIFSNRLQAICDEMGAVLRQAAFSPNIKDRLDYSCALFDIDGQLSAQAAHIPVHLGSMAYAMKVIVGDFQWKPGDMVIFNDPFMGGTHLPDVTLICPVFVGNRCRGFVANRAHHADIGACTPGSMPLSCHLSEEGIIIPPSLIVEAGRVNVPLLEWVAQQPLGTVSGKTAPFNEHGSPLKPAMGDVSAQMSACRIGALRLQSVIENECSRPYEDLLCSLNEYGVRLAKHSLASLPVGRYRYKECLDDDGWGNENIAICCELLISPEHWIVDFTGSADQVKGNVNCPLSVTAAAVYYVFRCLMPSHTPACHGVFSLIDIRAPLGSLLNAQRPAAVAAGNVETSTRVVDVLLGALVQAIPERIPAASHGSMNNVALGYRQSKPAGVSEGSSDVEWDYYETIGGGMGANSRAAGCDAKQTHMTNTLNTPIESVEMHYPLRVTHYGLRHDSGGAGEFKGGDGIVREYELLQSAQVTLLTERRLNAPWGLFGGEDGCPGINWHNNARLPAKCSFTVQAGDRFRIETAGGGGWGKSLNHE